MQVSPSKVSILSCSDRDRREIGSTLVSKMSHHKLWEWIVLQKLKSIIRHVNNKYNTSKCCLALHVVLKLRRIWLQCAGDAASVAVVWMAARQRALARGARLLLSLPSREKEAPVPDVCRGTWACARYCSFFSSSGPCQPFASSPRRLSCRGGESWSEWLRWRMRKALKDWCSRWICKTDGHSSCPVRSGAVTVG